MRVLAASWSLRTQPAHGRRSSATDAGESPIAGADGRTLAQAVHTAGKREPTFVADVTLFPQVIAETVCDGDVVLTMGAGSIGAVAPKLVRSDE